MSAPVPPSDLHARDPLLVTLAAGVIVHRFFAARYDPIYFDRSAEGRLNAPAGEFGVLYVSEQPSGAFAETFLRQPGRTLLPKDLLDAKAYARILTRRPLRLIRLAGPGLARLGATAEVVHGGLPYDTPQAWSAALHAHPIGADGIAYNARHDDEAVCYALFDRVQPQVEELDRDADLDQDWFWTLAEPYGVGLAPS